MTTPVADEQILYMRERIRKKQTTLSKGKKCTRCWLPKYSCICSSVKPLPFTLNVEFVTYLHETEWLNAADDAKLLCLAAPERTTLLVHGREGDDQRLQQLVHRASRSCLLFPDDKAIMPYAIGCPQAGTMEKARVVRCITSPDRKYPH